MKTQLAVGLLFGVACGRVDGPASPGGSSGNAVATVAGTPISSEALRVEAQRGAAPGGSIEVSLEQKLAALDKLIEREALFAKAKAIGFDQSPEMRRRIRNLIIAHFKEQQFPATQPVVRDEEIEMYYEKHRDRFALAAAVRGAAIFVSRPFAVSPERHLAIRQRAELLRHEAQTATDAGAFTTLAARHSEHQASRYRGGDLGWIAADETGVEPELAAALMKLSEPGQFAPLVETPRGFYVAKLTEKRDATVKPMADVKESIRYQLARQKAEQAERDFHASMKSGLDIRIHRDRVESLSTTESNSELPGGLGALSAQARD